MEGECCEVCRALGLGLLGGELGVGSKHALLGLLLDDLVILLLDLDEVALHLVQYLLDGDVLVALRQGVEHRRKSRLVVLGPSSALVAQQVLGGGRTGARGLKGLRHHGPLVEGDDASSIVEEGFLLGESLLLLVDDVGFEVEHVHSF